MFARLVRLGPALGALLLAACAEPPPPAPPPQAAPPPQEFKCPAGATWDGATCKAQHACQVEQDATAAAAQQSSACISESDCEAQCKGGAMRSCTDLAVKLDKKTNGATERTLDLYKKACFGGDGEGCYKLGAAYQYGWAGIEKDMARSVGLYHEACNCRNAGGCNDWGFFLERGEGVPKDEKQAAELYLRACNLGSPLGCKNTGVMYDNGAGFAKDDAKALKYYDRSCEAGQDSGCYNGALLYEKQSPPQYRAAIERYKKACDRGYALACTNYGYLVENGRGVDADAVVAVEYYKKGCEGGNNQGCSNVGVMWEGGHGTGRKDTARAVEYYEKACKMGLNDGCEKSKKIFSHLRTECDALAVAAKPQKPALGPKPTTPPPPPNEGCTNLGYLYEKGVGVAKDERAAADFYKKSCDAKLPTGCANLGNIYDAGQVYPQDFKKANELYKKACDLGSSGGCNNLGYAYATARGVPKNERRGLDLYKKACEKGSDTACNNIRHLTQLMAAAKVTPAAGTIQGPSHVGNQGSGSGASDALRPVTAPR
jgi:TPR repeat protein